MDRVENDDKIPDIIERLDKVDASKYPNFYDLDPPLEMSLWILLVLKEELGIVSLNSEEISEIIRRWKELSVTPETIVNSFNRSEDKVHKHSVDEGKAEFEIMKGGKDLILSKVQPKMADVCYFNPGEEFSSKRILAKDLLRDKKEELKIVDPYCSVRTLDILSETEAEQIKFLTQLNKLREKDREKFIRDYKDYRSEQENVEFRDYEASDLHDRYILSLNGVILVGHSLKDLGKKESFAVVINREKNPDIIQSLNTTFDRRWKQSEKLI